MSKLQYPARCVSVEFSKNGFKQYLRLNRCLGARFIRGNILCGELAAYIAAHYESHHNLDPVCSEVRYEDGVYLLLRQIGSTWYIADIWCDEEPVGFAPVLFWQRIKRGCSYLLAQIVIGWQTLTGKVRQVLAA